MLQRLHLLLLTSRYASALHTTACLLVKAYLSVKLHHSLQ